MRDDCFKAVHRGGPLDLHRHRLLAEWAADCAEHVLPLFSGQFSRDDRPRSALGAARAWARGEATLGEARAAAFAAHAAARDTAGAARAAARACGHAAGTAHMADHALRAAAYALQAVEAADRERTWQEGRLPQEIRALVLSSGEDRSTAD